jgi:hypothetical protein
VRRGTLTVVGTGIRAGLQLTVEAREALERADRVLFLSAEPVADAAIRALAPGATSLADLYEHGVGRGRAYDAMVEEMLAAVREGLSVCAAFYGHPGVLCTPGHDAVRRARAEGFEARMLATVSAEDCLFADLGLDPGDAGCQSYEATYFLEHRPPVDPNAILVLWQPSVLGRRDSVSAPDPRRLPELAGRLAELYGPGREAIVYEASPYPVGGGVARSLSFAELATATLPPLATLVVAPYGQPVDAAAEARSSAARADAAATTFPLAE